MSEQYEIHDPEGIIPIYLVYTRPELLTQQTIENKKDYRNEQIPTESNSSILIKKVATAD